MGISPCKPFISQVYDSSLAYTKADMAVVILLLIALLPFSFFFCVLDAITEALTQMLDFVFGPVDSLRQCKQSKQLGILHPKSVPSTTTMANPAKGTGGNDGEALRCPRNPSERTLTKSPKVR